MRCFLFRRLAPLLLVCVLLLFTGKDGYAKTGIITALNSTQEQLKKKIKITGYSTIGGRKFYMGKLGETEIILVHSPMGKVNNAVTTQLLISTYAPSNVLSISPAGAIGPEIRKGDIIVATEVYQHDFGTWKPYGFIWSKTPVYVRAVSMDYNHYPQSILLKNFKQKKSGKLRNVNKIMKGVLVSGDQFIASSKKRDWLHKKFDASAVDMGGAAIAQTCYVNKTPVKLIRIITDDAHLDARTAFADSMPSYNTTIDLTAFIENILINNL